MTTTGPKISRLNPFSSRTEVTSPASAFVSRDSSGNFVNQQDVRTALDLLESGNFKTLDEAMEAVRAFKLQGQTGPMTQLGSHGMEHLSRFNPSAIGSGSRRIRAGSALEDAGAVTRPWYRGTPISQASNVGTKLDLARRAYLGGDQYLYQTTGERLPEHIGNFFQNPPIPPTDLTDLGGASGDLAQHTGYTSIGGGGFDGGMGGEFSGVGNQYNMGNIATQSSLRTGDKPIWAGQEWGGKYGTPVATGENMKIGERMLKEAKDNMYKEACSECGKNCVSKAHCTTLKAELKKEKMNEKSGSKKPAHGMVIVIGTKAGPALQKKVNAKN